MTNTIGMKEWLDFVEEEYLSTFIRAGGGAVKFAIADKEKRAALRDVIKCDARNMTTHLLRWIPRILRSTCRMTYSGKWPRRSIGVG